MYDKYLVTGATGYLGGTLSRRLHTIGAAVRVLVLPGDPLAYDLPEGTELCYGSVDDKSSMEEFFSGADERTCVIHCAGIISIASKNSRRLWRVNICGTQNITDMCVERGVGKLVYVSSVHAIPEKPMGQCISECDDFAPGLVVGDYAKSKAAATAYVLQAAKNGLNASVVHPSGIIGPYDSTGGNVTGAIISYCQGKLSAGISGGYDFVDVRDVVEGIISCCDKGRPAACYILSGCYSSVKRVLQTVQKHIKGPKLLFCAPLSLIKPVAPLCEQITLRQKKPLFLTPYSIYTLCSNAAFSHERATKELDYHPRALEETLSDMVRWLAATGKISKKRRLISARQ